MVEFIEETLSNDVDSSIIWLHGLGASGHDFYGIHNSMRLATPNKIRFIFPHAPKLSVTINGNLIMPAWYDITGNDLSSRQDKEGIERSAKLISDLIEMEHDKGIPYHRIMLAGFSQGCAVALYTGLKFFKKPLAGIIALSGYLPLHSEFNDQNKINLATPLFFGHGANDDVVKTKWGKESRDLLVNLGYKTVWKEYNIGHSVTDEELIDVSDFINNSFL